MYPPKIDFSQRYRQDSKVPDGKLINPTGGVLTCPITTYLI